VLLSCVLLTAACSADDSEQQPEEDASRSPPPDASPPGDAQPSADAAPPDAARDDAGSLPPFVRTLPDSVCALSVGATCDGSEDCAQGESCCATFDPLLFRYESIVCEDDCNGSNEFTVCHPGEPCASAGEVCRASLIIPHDFIGVCAAPQSGVPPLMGTASAGEVACGADRCAVGSEQCCLRARYDFQAMSIDPLEPYCAALDAACRCNYVAPDADPYDEDGGGP
jgi:hypothetical protein